MEDSEQGKRVDTSGSSLKHGHYQPEKYHHYIVSSLEYGGSISIGDEIGDNPEAQIDSNQRKTKRYQSQSKKIPNPKQCTKDNSSSNSQTIFLQKSTRRIFKSLTSPIIGKQNSQKNQRQKSKIPDADSIKIENKSKHP